MPDSSATELARDASAMPLWEQVAQVLTAEIAELEPGTRLPSEGEQCARFAVSRVTLRQALAYVQRQGLVESRPGLGWFTCDPEAVRAEQEAREASQPVFEPPGKLLSFSEMARSRGMTADSIVLERRVRAAGFTEAEALNVMPGSELFLLKRLRRIDGLAVAVDTSLVPLAVLPHAMSIDFSSASLHECFRGAGAAPVVADTEVEAVVADTALAHLLEVAEGFPLLNVQQAFFDAKGRPIERAAITYRGDRYRYRARQRT